MNIVGITYFYCYTAKVGDCFITYKQNAKKIAILERYRHVSHDNVVGDYYIL